MQSYGSLLLRSGVKSLQAANTKTLDDWRVCLRRVNFDKNEYVRFELGRYPDSLDGRAGAYLCGLDAFNSHECVSVREWRILLARAEMGPMSPSVFVTTSFLYTPHLLRLKRGETSS